MDTQQIPLKARGLRRRDLLRASLAAGAALSAWPLAGPSRLWGAAAGPPKRGGILRVRGYDPAHFDPHLTPSFKTHCTLSFVYSRLVRHTVAPEVPPGTFMCRLWLLEAKRPIWLAKRLTFLGVPIAGVQKTTIRTFTVKGEEENEGLRPRISWT